jgi:hypothetical protein
VLGGATHTYLRLATLRRAGTFEWDALVDGTTEPDAAQPAECGDGALDEGEEPRAVQGPEPGRVVELPEVGGRSHRHEREAA